MFRVIRDLFGYFEKRHKESKFNTTVCRIIEDILKHHPHVTWQMKSQFGIFTREFKEERKLFRSALPIGINLWIAGRKRLAGRMSLADYDRDSFFILFSEKDDVDIDEAIVLFENKVIVHGEWKKFIVDYLEDLFKETLNKKEKIKQEKSQQVEAEKSNALKELDKYFASVDRRKHEFS